jgi:hypothetical protein
MADTLVERLTGHTTASAVPVEINLVMTDRTLLAGDHEPAHLDGYGPIPAALARDLVRDADKTWVRRLFTRPTDGSLVAMESRRRLFDGLLRKFLILRDQTCRNSWCDAVVRHADHIVPVTDGGPTSADNGQGLCEACNYTKQQSGWTARRIPGSRHPIQITTPTGHTYLTHAPDPPGTPRRFPYRLEILFQRVA